MSGAMKKMGQYDTVREAAGSPVPTPPQAGACTCSFCSAVQKLQLALVTAPLEGAMGTTVLTLGAERHCPPYSVQFVTPISFSCDGAHPCSPGREYGII